jgi:hypothetical protein
LRPASPVVALPGRPPCQQLVRSLSLPLMARCDRSLLRPIASTASHGPWFLAVPSLRASALRAGGQSLLLIGKGIHSVCINSIVVCTPNDVNPSCLHTGSRGVSKERPPPVAGRRRAETFTARPGLGLLLAHSKQGSMLLRDSSNIRCAKPGIAARTGRVQDPG